MAEAHEEPTTVQLEVDWDTAPAATFANFVHLTQTGDDFVLFFGDFVGTPQVLERARKTGRAAVPLKAAIRLPPRVVLATLASLSRAWNAYVDTDPPGVQRLPRLEWPDDEGISE